ncbi:MAG: DUF4143 domain-containing protein [Acidimicrobiaceae bacterium]|nr:DUF4143 domain-containing protein [Acidimicrobiaceae bacterium]
MRSYVHRLTDPLIEQLLADLSAVLVVGARATGKTTTALQHAASSVRLDHDAQAAAFRADPDAALAGLAEPVLLDEWQAVPAVLGAVKRAVDSDPRPGRFIVTGSVRSNSDGGMWPGTGRLVTVDMHPLTVSEQLGTLTMPLVDRVVAGAPLIPADPAPDLRGYVALALRGGFPEAALAASDSTRQRWLRSYLRYVAERDAPALEAGRDPVKLTRFIEAYALNSAGMATDSTLFGAADISRDTGVAYHRLLSDLRIVADLPAWASNRLSRLVKAPKRFFVDSALVAASAGVSAPAVMSDGNLLGRLIETFAVAQLRAESAVSDLFPRLHHLREAQGRREIDVIAELADRRIVAIEIKSAAAVSRSDARHLLWLKESAGDRFAGGVVLHTGPRTYELGQGITAAPISTLWA